MAYEDRRGPSAASGGRCAGATPWPFALLLYALVADGPDPAFSLGCIRLSRRPAALVELLRQDGYLHHRALLSAFYGAGLFHGPAQHLRDCWLDHAPVRRRWLSDRLSARYDNEQGASQSYPFVAPPAL